MSGSTVEQSTVNWSRKGATRRREDTIERKKASRLFQQLRGRRWLLGRMLEVISEGKRGLDGLALELGRIVAEAVMFLEREEIAGPDYQPHSSEVRKWASHAGSVFIGNRKVKVEHPRLRGVAGEMELRTYGKLKERGEFLEELLGRVLRGLAGRRHQETLVGGRPRPSGCRTVRSLSPPH
jgi:hypothetical protein